MKASPFLLAPMLCMACASGGASDPRVEEGPDAASSPPSAAVNDGPVSMAGPDGRLRMEGNMRGGRRHGVWTSYHPDGSVQSRCAYVDGLVNGVTVVFHPNGQPHYIGSYRMGVQVGEWRFFDEAGGLVKTVHYDSTGTAITDR